MTFAALTALAVLAAAPASAENEAGSGQDEFPNETRALLTATAAFFDTVEATAPAKPKRPVFRLPKLALNASFRGAEEPTGALTARGPVQHLTGYRINWYPTERLFGAVDFMGTWDGNRNLVCGYLMWDLSDPGAPDLHGLSVSFVDVSDLDGQSDSEIHRTLLEANCAFGAVEPNYRLFDTSG